VSVGLLLITHQSLGTELLRIGTGIFGTCPARAASLEVENDAPRDALLAQGRRLVAELDAGDGVLILTDIYGATPARLAMELTEGPRRIRLIAGVNLPMLVRALNYAGLDLDTVADKALAGGREGVLPCTAPGERN
jgi:mannose PTS system EIIA component